MIGVDAASKAHERDVVFTATADMADAVQDSSNFDTTPQRVKSVDTLYFSILK